MEKKQSSIDFLIEEVKKHHPLWRDIFIKAKAMHKEEIIETWYESRLLSDYISSNQYYNETFGGQDNA